MIIYDRKVLLKAKQPKRKKGSCLSTTDWISKSWETLEVFIPSANSLPQFTCIETFFFKYLFCIISVYVPECPECVMYLLSLVTNYSTSLLVQTVNVSFWDSTNSGDFLWTELIKGRDSCTHRPTFSKYPVFVQHTHTHRHSYTHTHTNTHTHTHTQRIIESLHFTGCKQEKSNHPKTGACFTKQV